MWGRAALSLSRLSHFVNLSVWTTLIMDRLCALVYILSILGKNSQLKSTGSNWSRCSKYLVCSDWKQVSRMRWCQRCHLAKEHFLSTRASFRWCLDQVSARKTSAAFYQSFSSLAWAIGAVTPAKMKASFDRCSTVRSLGSMIASFVHMDCVQSVIIPWAQSNWKRVIHRVRILRRRYNLVRLP